MDGTCPDGRTNGVAPAELKRMKQEKRAVAVKTTMSVIAASIMSVISVIRAQDWGKQGKQPNTYHTSVLRA